MGKLPCKHPQTNPTLLSAKFCLLVASLMSLALSDLKKINNKHQFLVFGFIRNQQNNLSLSIIPPIISYLCLGFYYHGNYFSKYPTENIKASDDGMTITCYNESYDQGIDKYYYNMAYTKIWIESMSDKIAKWKIRINKCVERILFRIVSVEENIGITTSPYGFTNRGAAYSYGKGKFIPRDKLRFEQGDIVTIILNTKDASIATERNGDHDNIKMIFTGIETGDDLKYKLAFNLYKTNDSVTMLDFELNEAVANK